MNNIVSINADRRPQALAAISQGLSTNPPIALLIQDPPLHIEEWIGALDDAGYICVRPPRGDRAHPHENLVIIRHDSITSREPKLITPISTTVEIRHKDHNFLLTSVYIRPRLHYTSLKQSLDSLETIIKEHGQSRAIIAGDVNATDPDWAPTTETAPELDNTARTSLQMGEKHYSQLKQVRGKQIALTMNRLKLTCLNNPSSNPPTFVSKQRHRTASHIRVAYAGNKAIRIWSSLAITDIGAQHRMVSIKASGQATETIKTRRVCKTDKITRRHLQALEIEFNSLANNLNQLNLIQLRTRAEQMTTSIMHHLLNAQEAVTTTQTDRTPRANRSHTYLRLRITRVATRLNAIDRATNNLKRKKHKSRSEVQTLRAKARKHAKLSNEIIGYLRQQLLPSEACEGNNLWARIQAALRPRRDKTRADQTMSQDELEAIATDKFGAPVSPTEAETRRLRLDDIDQSQQLIINKCETSVALTMVRDRRFTGPNGLKYTTLINAARHIEHILHIWCETCIRAAYTPNECKLTQGAIIPKKVPGKFRIVHVGNPMTSLLERIILSRLEHRLEQLNLFCNHQFGFSANISRHDLVTRVIELTLRNAMREEGDKRRRHTTVVSLDIKGAFDNVDQHMISDKLVSQLKPDPLRFWLADFVHGRRTTLKSGERRSETRAVTKGVPQGSILGPVLWNLTINQLSERISLPGGELEVLAYADDIVLVYMGDNTSLLQNKINELIEEITQLKLEVDTDKCSVISLRYERGRTGPTVGTGNTPTITVYGQTIPKTTTVSILGVPITQQLRIDLDNTDKKLSLKDSAQLLNRIKRLNIVHTIKDWQTLIDSYLTSTIITNNIPILAIDNRARAWCDITMTRAIKKVFDWPSNSSNKIARLITNTHANTESLVMKSLTIRAAKANGEGYRLLLDLAQLNGNISALKRLADECTDPETLRYLDHTHNIWPIRLTAHLRRYHDPGANTITDAPRYSSVITMCMHKGPTWIVIEGGKTAVAAEVLDCNILQAKSARHCEFAVGYFNLMGLLWNMASDDNVSNRSLAMPESSSTLMALQNMSNRDWRVISLREKLHFKGWRICILTKDAHTDAARFISGTLKSQQSAGEKVHPHNMSWATWPLTHDYEAANIARYNFNRQVKALAANNNSKLTRLLTGTDTELWLQLNPAHIDGRTMLTLSGMVSIKGTLERGDLGPEETPKGCTDNCNRRTEERQVASNSHTTLHRLFHCPRFAKQRAELRKSFNHAIAEEYRRRSGNQDMDISLYAPWKHERATHITLGNRRFAQVLLRIMQSVAMNMS